MVIYLGVRCRFAYGPADVTATHKAKVDSRLRPPVRNSTTSTCWSESLGTIATPSQWDRATATNNKHENLVKFGGRVVIDASRQTDKKTYTSQCFALLPEGEVPNQTSGVSAITRNVTRRHTGRLTCTGSMSRRITNPISAQAPMSVMA